MIKIKKPVYCFGCSHLFRNKHKMHSCIIGTWENTFHGGIPHDPGDDIHKGMTCWAVTESALLKNINKDCPDFEQEDKYRYWRESDK